MNTGESLETYCKGKGKFVLGLVLAFGLFSPAPIVRADESEPPAVNTNSLEQGYEEYARGALKVPKGSEARKALSLRTITAAQEAMTQQVAAQVETLNESDPEGPALSKAARRQKRREAIEKTLGPAALADTGKPKTKGVDAQTSVPRTSGTQESYSDPEEPIMDGKKVPKVVEFGSKSKKNKP